MTEQGDVPREGLASDDPSVMHVENAQGTWLSPLRTWVERQPEATRALFPDDFWLDPIYLVGAPELHTAVLAAHPEQVTRLRTINEALVEAGEAPFPVWGPEDVEQYVGGLLPLMDWSDQARLVMQVSRAIVKGVRCGEQGMKERLLGGRGYGNYL